MTKQECNDAKLCFRLRLRQLRPRAHAVKLSCHRPAGGQTRIFDVRITDALTERIQRVARRVVTDSMPRESGSLVSDELSYLRRQPLVHSIADDAARRRAEDGNEDVQRRLVRLV